MRPAVQQIVVLVLLLLGFFFLVVRPQRNRARELAAVRASLQVGSQVMTTAGLYATVAALDGDVVTLEVAPGVRSRYATTAIVRLVEAAGPVGAAGRGDSITEGPRS